MESRILIPKDKIVARINELATDIAKDYAEKQILLLTILNGAMPTVTYLMTALWEQGLRDAELGTIRISSYPTGTNQAEPKITKAPSANLANRNVLIVEDIIDTGKTMQFLYTYLHDKKPKSIRTFTLLSKPGKRETPFTADYTGFEIEDVWVEGFGMDTDEKNRGCPDIIVRRN